MQINYGVNGTEVFRNHPVAAAATLQGRAAHLWKEGRLDEYFRHRHNSPFAQRPQPIIAAYPCANATNPKVHPVSGPCRPRSSSSFLQTDSVQHGVASLRPANHEGFFGGGS